MDFRRANRIMQGRGLNTLNQHIRAGQRMPQLAPTPPSTSTANLLLRQLQRHRQQQQTAQDTKNATRK